MSEAIVILCACAVALALATWRQLPELDWSLGKGPLRVDGIRIGMTPKQAYAAMGERGGDLTEHLYRSKDGRTFFLGGSEVLEVASFDCLYLPDETQVRAGEPVLRLATLWPLRYRADKQGLAPMTIEVSKNGFWYEGAGNLWVYANHNRQIEYFDLSSDAAHLGGP